jgi:16S rRNA (guanine527-N7)-methyltransferase
VADGPAGGARVDLDAALAALDVALPADAGGRLRAYLTLLAKWNRVYNLTAVREPERMVTHHLLDSLAVLPLLAGGPGTRVLDIGTGAGLPGIPLAIARPKWALTLIDANQKKASFVQQAISELGLRNAVAQAIRAEALPPGVGFDLVISRAFAELAAFVAVARPLLAPRGRIVAMKGQLPQPEIDALPAGVRVVAAPSLSVPGLPAQRHLVIIEATESRP